MTAARSIRSNAVPAGRDRDTQPSHERPVLHVVSGRKRSKVIVSGFKRVMGWTRTGHTTMIQIVCAVAFLVASLVTSLIVSTMIVQNTFTASEVKANISRLEQDVDDEQAALDDLEASLPERAKDMGMEPQQGSISIDLSGYSGPGGTQQ